VILSDAHPDQEFQELVPAKELRWIVSLGFVFALVLIDDHEEMFYFVGF